jgi:GxxExxY protein
MPATILEEQDLTYKIIIEEKIILEIKVLPSNFLQKKYYNQVLGYLNQLKIRIALITNFKGEKLWVKRILLPQKYLLNSA